MAGEASRLLHLIVQKRANGNPTIELTTKTKLMLKGINFESFSPSTPDDPAIIKKIKEIALEMGVTL